MADIASQGEIYAQIEGQGLKKLERCKSIDIKDGRSTEVVMAIGIQRGAGFRRKQGGFEITMAIYDEVGRAPEIDWYLVNEAYADFILQTVNEGDGFRYTYLSRVSKVDTKKDEQGDFMLEVSLVALSVDRR